MEIQAKSSNGITLVPLEAMLLSSRKVFLTGEINSKSACEFAQQIMLLASESRDEPIKVLINSPGGEIVSGLAIYDIIQSSDAPIKLYCIGRAYSMAAVIFASGTDGRYMLPNSELMLHEPLIGGNINGSSSSIKSISDSLLETRRKLNGILAKHSGKSEQEIDEITSHDHYFSSYESIEFGICDGVVSFNEIMEG